MDAGFRTGICPALLVQNSIEEQFGLQDEDSASEFDIRLLGSDYPVRLNGVVVKPPVSKNVPARLRNNKRVGLDGDWFPKKRNRSEKQILRLSAKDDRLGVSIRSHRDSNYEIAFPTRTGFSAVVDCSYSFKLHYRTCRSN